MANHKSAMKRIRQNAKRHTQNKEVRSEVRTLAKKVLEAIDSGTADTAREALRATESAMAKSSRKGATHRKQTQRTVSRLNTRVKAMAAASA